MPKQLILDTRTRRSLQKEEFSTRLTSREKSDGCKGFKDEVRDISGRNAVRAMGSALGKACEMHLSSSVTQGWLEWWVFFFYFLFCLFVCLFAENLPFLIYIFQRRYSILAASNLSSSKGG